MNARKESGWIEKFSPDVFWDAPDNQEILSGAKSTARMPAQGMQLLSCISHDGNDHSGIAETKTQERLTKLACLYEISRAMLRIHSVDELCQQLIEHMRLAWQSYDLIFPFIEIDGNYYAAGEPESVLIHKFSVPLLVNGDVAGQVGVLSKDMRVTSWPENEDTLFLKNIASDLGLWLEQKKLADAQNSLGSVDN